MSDQANSILLMNTANHHIFSFDVLIFYFAGEIFTMNLSSEQFHPVLHFANLTISSIQLISFSSSSHPNYSKTLGPTFSSRAINSYCSM